MSYERTQALRCAIYTRKSSDEGLEQSFNSLDAQREACEAYILSQRHEGWQTLTQRYDDGGFSGGSMQRPALQALMQDIELGRIDLIVVYKVDRLTRSLADFAKMVELFDAKKISFVSVTQQFNTTTSMGRLTLNVLLSFAQFEREVTGERIRDKIAASKKKGMWMGGHLPVGYDAAGRKLVPNPTEAAHVRHLFERYLALGCVSKLKAELDEQKIYSKIRITQAGKQTGGCSYSRGALYELLKNRLYIGEIVHRHQHYPGQHEAIIPLDLWEKVQAKLQENVQGYRSGVRAKEPSLLVGRVFDTHGRRLTPSHAVKRGKRYRYYVTPSSQKTYESTPAVRIPAQDLEDLVVERIHALLGAKQQLLDTVATTALSAEQQKALLDSANKHLHAWTESTLVERYAFIQRVVTRVLVKDKSVEIHLSCVGLQRAFLENGTLTSTPSAAIEDQVRDDAIILTVDAQVMRSGLEVRLVIAGDTPQGETARISQSLIKAIARGRHWYEQLTSGTRVTLGELAAESGVNDRYASRILRCAFLAPDIVEAILEGKQPAEMTLDRMLETLSLDWKEQRRVWGV